MVLNANCEVIGLTGAFGSGCSTAAERLRHERGFALVRLSDPIRKRWSEESDHQPTRHDLQRLGDEIRLERGASGLVDLALDPVVSALEDHEGVVIDSIRNLGEVAYLKNRFGYKFTLIAILASPGDRWTRIGDLQYRARDLGEDNFIEDDSRDRNEETLEGQQVQRCIDRADVFIDNTGDTGLQQFLSKVLTFADLVTGKESRHASDDEIFMHMAYSASHSSKCLKRQVGAIIVDSDNDVVGVGYNENPGGTKPCAEEPTYDYQCFRDIVRNEQLAQLHAQGKRCPTCGYPIARIEGPPWRCSNCESSGEKTDLEVIFFPDRAMSWCTAIHAEVRAVLSSSATSVRGARLYTTTFPCFQCAEKLTQVGIAEIIFTEVYPDVRAADRLDLASIEYRQFEGVRSSAFERIFERVRPS